MQRPTSNQLPLRVIDAVNIACDLATAKKASAYDIASAITFLTASAAELSRLLAERVASDEG